MKRYIECEACGMVVLAGLIDDGESESFWLATCSEPCEWITIEDLTDEERQLHEARI